MILPRVVLIHGGNGSPAEIVPLTTALREYCEVLLPTMLGHGGRPIVEHLTTRALADDILAWMDEQHVDKAWFMGYSVGGYLALYLARHHPQRVLGAGAIAAKALFDEKTVQHLCYLASVERLSKPGNPRAAELEKTHAPQDWRAVARMNQGYFQELGRDPPLSDSDLAAIGLPVILFNANRDQLVPWPETLELGKRIPGAKLVMFYGVAHPLKVVPVHSIAKIYSEWIQRHSSAAPARTS